jgi:hypothetical protein
VATEAVVVLVATEAVVVLVAIEVVVVADSPCFFFLSSKVVNNKC